jgi:Flp pilus assembly protein TadG
MLRHRQDRAEGQALVEFSLVLIPFLILMMAVFDLGRGIYMMNSTAEAAREIARVTVVHPYNSCTSTVCDLGSSTKAQAVVATQRQLVPNLQFTTAPDVVCLDKDASLGGADVVKADRLCRSGDFVRVRVQAPFQAATPLVAMFGSHTFESTSRIKIP